MISSPTRPYVIIYRNKRRRPRRDIEELEKRIYFAYTQGNRRVFEDVEDSRRRGIIIGGYLASYILAGINNLRYFLFISFSFFKSNIKDSGRYYAITRYLVAICQGIDEKPECKIQDPLSRARSAIQYELGTARRSLIKKEKGILELIPPGSCFQASSFRLGKFSCKRNMAREFREDHLVCAPSSPPPPLGRKLETVAVMRRWLERGGGGRIGDGNS